MLQGQGIALSGTGHVGDTTPNVHLGVRLNGEYVDPLDYLSPASVVDLIRPRADRAVHGLSVASPSRP